ncbi:MAG: ArnT family glycosyltransferase [Candidatus Micrarchaeia archaeon]
MHSIGSARKDIKGIAIVLSIIALALILSYIFYSGPFVYYDDNCYIYFAHQMIQGTFVPNDMPFSVETLTIASLALSFIIFGYGALQAALPSLFEYIATIIVIFLLGRKMFNDYFAGIASFLFATAPFVLGYTTRALPDMFTALAVTIAAYFLYDAIKLNSKRAFFIAGFFATFTMLIKTAGLIVIISFVASLFYLFFSKKFRMSIGYSVLGMAIPLLAMFLCFFALVHNPFYNLYIYSSSFKNMAPTTFYENLKIFNISINPLLLLNVKNAQGSPHVYPLGAIALLAIVGSILGIIKKDKFIISSFIISAIPMLYIFFGSKSIFQYIPISIVSRYFEIVAAPMAILATYALFKLYKSVSRASKPAAWLTIFLILGFAMLTNALIYHSFYNYHLGIRSYNVAYQFILGQMPPGSNNVLFASMLPGSDTQYLEFLSSFKKNFSILPSKCNASYNNVLLINSFTNFNINQQSSLIAKWLGNNCTTKIISSYNMSTGQSLYTKVDLYKIISYKT